MPAWARPSAIARPSPLPAPVTMATRPFSELSDSAPSTEVIGYTAAKGLAGGDLGAFCRAGRVITAAPTPIFPGRIGGERRRRHFGGGEDFLFGEERHVAELHGL